MITTNEAQNILIHDCADFGIQTFPTWNVPEGRIKDERIVVVTPSEQSPATYWESCYISVNLCVPDVKGTANLKRLGELERIAKAKFKPWAYEYMIIHHIVIDMKVSAEKRTKTSDATISMSGPYSEC